MFTFPFYKSRCLCIHLPCGVRDIDATQVYTLTAHDEEGGEAQKRNPTADHGQLGRLAGSKLKFLYDVAAQYNAHACTRHNNDP